MKRKILGWTALVWAMIFLGGSNAAWCFDLPPTNGPAKLLRFGAWTNITVKLIIPGSSNPPAKCVTQEVAARRADYQIIPAPPQPYWNQFSILAIHDPAAKMNCVLFSDHMFFASGKSGVTGFSVFTPGLNWSPSFVAVPDSQGDLNAAIAKFEKESDGWRLNAALLQERRDNLNLQKVSPIFYFLEKPVGGSPRVNLKVDGFGIIDGILQLDVSNPSTHEPANYWINWKARKVVKSIVAGREINLEDTNQPWGEYK